jgi:hypothetical protein
VTTTDGSIHVARDAGEFGGRLESIHVGGSGRRTTEERVLSGPMTDVVVDPTNRRCVMASGGLDCVDSRVVRSCPGELSIILEFQDPRRDAGRQTGQFDMRCQTSRVDKLIANGSTVYAVGPEETYAFSGRATRRLPAPTFAEHCGLTVAHLEGVMMLRFSWTEGPRKIRYYHRWVMPAL